MPLSASPTASDSFSLGTFKRIVLAAVLAGSVAGVALTAVQGMQVVPLILQAEVYEAAAPDAAQAPEAARPHEHAEAQPAAHEHEDDHHHDANAWQPEDGVERTAYTALANISLGVGFALLLIACISLRDRPTTWRSGLLWGLGGYLTFFVAPSLGLPPEVPGTAGAALGDRQLWWAGTAACTAGGLALLSFARGGIRWAGLALLALPHLIGAPQPVVHSSTAPQELARAFVFATAIANAAFWLCLGACAGHFYKKAA
ncbi:CbtA family protein [Lysobacter korlensis]|uniref:CbtA family protein n=1 Tax=Lysobacter korlensis TaxID=553636 RepID=A0ABV6RTM2_9GAMM